MKSAILIFLLSFFLHSLIAQPNKLAGKRVLIFTKNGKGYVHENIPFSIAAWQKMGAANKFTTDTSTNAALFTDANLQQYDAIIFSNTNNDVFDTDAQRLAFRRYMQAGGGFMGVHSASGTERNWKWFKLMLGATFLRHPPFQSFTVHVLDKDHPSTKNLPPSWGTQDECYYFKEINPSVQVLLVSDISQIKEEKNAKPDIFGNRYPAAWCHEFDGGRSWYTALGHDKTDYENPVYLTHILEGLKWVCDKPRPDYNKARATRADEDEWELLR